MYNMWNYVNFGSNNGNYSGIGHNANSPATFGVLQSAGSPRDIQFGLKLSF